MVDTVAGIPAISNPYAGDVFADEAIGFEFINGTIRVSFGVVRMTDAAAPSPVHMVNIGRLVIGISGAQNLAMGLYDYLKNQGLDPAARASEGLSPQ